MREEYKGFVIKTAKPTGGKAGKGRNKTTTLMVFDPVEGLLLKLFRYTLNDLQSFYSARLKAYDYIEKRLTSRAPDALRAAALFGRVTTAKRR